tara:strand:+ start:2501 stop:3409 length:909 start_codon:yes stop_codon:yes gene_type:complete
MAIKLGSASISKLYLGSNEILKAYLGSNEVFSSGDTTTFITTWRTTTSNESITIPTNGGGYNYDLTTSDGQEYLSLTGSKTITFATAGDYDVSISGDFPRIYINNNATNKVKLIDIKQWGNIVWSSFRSAFYGCSNLTGSFTDAPNLTNVTTLERAFYQCSLFNQNIGSWDVSNVTNMNRTFFQAFAFNQPIGNWDVSNVTNMNRTLFQNTNFNQSLNWDVSSATDMSVLLSGATLSTANYDATLINLESKLQAIYPNGNGYTANISTSFGTSKYTGGGLAAAAHASLGSVFSWSIADGGIA